MVQPAQVAYQFYQFETLGGFSKSLCIFFILIWLYCVWEIWNKRNAYIFRQQESSLQQLIDKIKLQTFIILVVIFNIFIILAS